MLLTVPLHFRNIFYVGFHFGWGFLLVWWGPLLFFGLGGSSSVLGGEGEERSLGAFQGKKKKQTTHKRLGQQQKPPENPSQKHGTKKPQILSF